MNVCKIYKILAIWNFPQFKHFRQNSLKNNRFAESIDLTKFRKFQRNLKKQNEKKSKSGVDSNVDVVVFDIKVNIYAVDVDINVIDVDVNANVYSESLCLMTSL